MHFNYLEMKYLVFCVTVNFLFFANIVSSSTVTIKANYDDAKTFTKKYEIRQALQLKCNITLESKDKAKLVVTWQKDGELVTEIDKLKKRLSLSHNGDIYKLQLNYADESDGGNYECIATVDGIPYNATFKVESKIHVKIPREISVIAGEKLRVICQVHGNPIPKIEWVYKNQTYPGGPNTRVKLEAEPEKNVTNAVFIIEEIDPEDQSELICKGISVNSKEKSDPAVGTIRVKDKYAALWPFLGICAEVLVLCAIILIYENKRNKTELEESDTDQSPEQKNTPDHGGKESNLRHRQ